MAYVPLRTIAELSEKVQTEWDVKYAALIKQDAKQMNNLTQVIQTQQEAINIPFINSFETLEKLELYGTPTYRTVRGEVINRAIAKYAKGLSIGRFTWSDPKSQSLLMNQLDALVAVAGWRRTLRVIDILNEGDTNSEFLSYDGKQYFANDHDLNGQVVDNLQTWDGSDPDANVAEAFRDIRNIFHTLRFSDDGKKLPTVGANLTIICHPYLETSFATLLRSQTLYKADVVVDNPYKNMAGLITNNQLESETDWFLLMDLPGISPFVTVEHVDSSGALRPYIDEGDLNVRERDTYEWLVKIVEETHPVHWYLAIKVKDSSAS